MFPTHDFESLRALEIRAQQMRAEMVFNMVKTAKAWIASLFALRSTAKA